MRYLLISLIFLLIPPIHIKAYAGNVVVNEFVVESSQWVELYNKGNEAVNISGWIIDDVGGSQKYTIPENITIAPSEYKVFESGLFNFNISSEDTVRLLNGETLEDSFSYGASPNGKSYGRKTDGEDSWVSFTVDTKGSSNNNAQAALTPTLTPTNTPTPKPTPTPTKMPTPTPTSKPANTQIPQKTPTPLPAQFSTLTPTRIQTAIPSSKPVLTSAKNKEVLGRVLAADTSSNITTPKPAKTPENKKSGFPLWLVFVVLGFAILASGCGILLYQQYRKQREQEL